MSKLTLEDAISHCLEVAEQKEHDSITTTGDYELDIAMKEGCIQCAADHRQLAEWLTELKELREENKVLMQECDRLIKEKGELLSKVGDSEICQLEEYLEKTKQPLNYFGIAYELSTKAIEAFKQCQKVNPNGELIIETPINTVHCKFGNVDAYTNETGIICINVEEYGEITRGIGENDVD